jgi:hypothetical protein
VEIAFLSSQFPGSDANHVQGITYSMCLLLSCVLWLISDNFHFLHNYCRTIQFAYKSVPFVLYNHITGNGMIGDEAVLAYFKVLSLHMAGGAEENH